MSLQEYIIKNKKNKTKHHTRSVILCYPLAISAIWNETEVNRYQQYTDYRHRVSHQNLRNCINNLRT